MFFFTGVEDLKEDDVVIDYPKGETEGVWDLYTTSGWREIFDVMNDVLGDMSGTCTYMKKERHLECSVRLAKTDTMFSTAATDDSPPVTTDKAKAEAEEDKAEVGEAGKTGKPTAAAAAAASASALAPTTPAPETVTKAKTKTKTKKAVDTTIMVIFTLQVLRSRVFVAEEGTPAATAGEVVHAVRLRRLSGDVLQYRSVVQNIVLPKCAAVITGLPKWAREQVKATAAAAAAAAKASKEAGAAAAAGKESDGEVTDEDEEADAAVTDYAALLESDVRLVGFA